MAKAMIGPQQQWRQVQKPEPEEISLSASLLELTRTVCFC